jgi:type VI secretion system protein ImpA
MKSTFDIGTILSPIPGENPAGEDLRYTPLYDELKEARRADDLLDRGDWVREIKTSDWDTVIDLAVDALTHKTKDLQIGAWLCEALTEKEQFDGLFVGLRVLNGLLSDYWEHLYPVIVDEDLDFRTGPIEYLNKNLGSRIKQIPLTDSDSTPGFSWFKWQESRKVGREEDTHNQFGDVDEEKRKRREELIAEGKLKAEDFELAVIQSPVTYYATLQEKIARCREAFNAFDEVVEKRFGTKNAPNLQDLRQTFEDLQLFMRSEKIRGKLKMNQQAEQAPPAPVENDTGHDDVIPIEQNIRKTVGQDVPLQTRTSTPVSGGSDQANTFSNTVSSEPALWENALEILNTSGIKSALGRLYKESCSAPSEREKHRRRLLMAQLCLKAERPDLARPIAEQLQTLIEELHLERWESPVWIGEVLDTLYQCLTHGEPSDEDKQRARGLLQKLCTTDVTKALIHRH